MPGEEVYLPILEAHALHTSTNTDVDHARLERIGNVGNGLEATGALSVQTLDGGSLRETGNEGSGTELGRTTARGKDRANRDVLNQLRVDSALFDNRLENAGQHVRGRSILEATLSALGQGGPEGASDHNVIGVLLGDGATLVATEVGGNLVESLLSWRRVSLGRRARGRLHTGRHTDGDLGSMEE